MSTSIIKVLAMIIIAICASTARLNADDDAHAKVRGVHHVELASGVDAAEFEKFVKEKFNKAWAKPRDGMQLMVSKGLRGDRKGKYALVYVFDSLEARDKHFPEEGSGGSEAYVKALTPVLEVTQQLFNMFRSVGYTDYAAIK